MKTRHFKAGILASTLLAGMSALSPAFAQDVEEVEDAEESALLTDRQDQVIVTGSRLLTNPNLAAAQPVLSVSGDEADVRGNVRIEDFVNILPQVFANQAGEVSNGATGTAALDLRGLGPIRTLVLIDSHRLPYGDSSTSAPNLDLVPTGLIERVDILTGGASAVYGSDAISGVANFVLKRDFEGIELEILGGIAQNGNGVEPWDSVLEAGGQPVPDGAWDGEELTINLTMGANTPDGRGNVTLFGSYETKEAITQDDRSISGCALGQSSGPNSFAGFGCVGSGNFRAFGGSGGFGFQEEDGTIVPFVGGPAQTYNFGPRNFFQRPSERFQIYARGHYALTDSVEAFADLSFVNNSSDAQIAESASFGSWTINCDNPLIQDTPGLELTDLFGCTADDIANGTQIPGLFASHRMVEGGPRNSNLENTAWRMVGGFRGDIADIWNWEVFANFSRTQDQDISTNDLVVANVQQAFLVTTDPDTGEPVCIDPSGGCVPFNIFQRAPDGSSLVTQEQVDFLTGVGITTGETEQLVFGGNIQADLGNYGVQSPWSDAGVGFLIGGEWRDNDLVAVPDEISQIPGGGFTGVGGATLPVAGSVEVWEVFAEVQIPIVTDKEFFEELTLSGQYRYSDYSANGNDTEGAFETDSYAVQATWAPTQDFKLRGQYQRAVRAPNVIELFTGQNTGLPNLSPAGTNANGVQLFDPCASDAPIATLEQCQRTGVTAAQYGNIFDVISGQTQSVTGGNPDLAPEVADTYTVGIVVTPSMVPNLSISVDYFDIVVDEAIFAGIPAQTTLDNCLATGDPVFCSLINRAPNGSLAAGFGSQFGFTQTNINIGEISTKGVDFQVLYSFDLADLNAGMGDMGGVRFDYASTYLDELNTVPFPGADPIVCAGFFGNNCGTPSPEYRHRLMTTWESPWNWEATVTWRYFGGTDNDNPNDTLEPELETVNYVDLSGNIEVTENLRLRGGVLNVLNKQAPVFSGAGPALGNGNTYPTVFDTGRFFFAAAVLNF